MRCILCLTVSDHVIHIFEDQSFNLDINKIIAKHFWLQPNKGDDNSNYICCSCWNILETFHNFYEKVEAAHRNLLNVTTKSVRLENDFKEEKESDADNFDGSPDYTAGIKLEVNENITSVNHLTSLDEKINTFDRFANADVTDSDSEIPLARLIKCRRSSSNKDTLQESNENDEPLSDGPFCDNYDGDSDYECNNIKLKDIFSDDCNYKPPKPIKRSKKSTKSQQKTKSENKECRAKRKTIDPVRKRELSKEFDEVIEKNLKLSCSLCHIPLANFFLLRKHYHNAHKERGYATCCGKKFRKRGVLVDHIYLHLNPEFFKCDRCERILADRRSLEVHMSTHDTSKERIYQCQECNKSFYRKLLLDRHMYTHIPDRKFNCEDCQKLFSSDYTLRQHINNVHNSAYNKICEQCGKSIRGPQAFRRHQLEHAGAAVPLVQCEKCGVKLTNKYGLKRHMDSMHPETKIVHDCKLCGKIAPSLAALQRHISYMHKCERNHKCPMCDKAFKKPSGLRVRRNPACDGYDSAACTKGTFRHSHKIIIPRINMNNLFNGQYVN